MSIRKMLAYDQRTKMDIGYVDLGFGPQVDGPPASEILVFLLTGVRANWKAPIAYFCTATLTAATQRELIVHTIRILQENGFVVTCLTMDGHASNLGMIRSLGAQMNISANRIEPYFVLENSDDELQSQTNDKIFVLLDPCHMVKLLRNTWNAYGCFKSSDGLIKWSFLTELHRIQDTVGLRLGNKLSVRHILFQQNKMKVFLIST